MKTAKRPNRETQCARRNPKSEIREVVRETAKNLHDAGAIDQEAMREIDQLCRAPIEPPTADGTTPIDRE